MQGRSIQQWLVAKLSPTSCLDEIALVALRHMLNVSKLAGMMQVKLKVVWPVILTCSPQIPMVVYNLHSITAKPKDSFWDWGAFDISPIYLDERDKTLLYTEIPIVLVFNGEHHYCPTTLLPDGWINMERRERAIEHCANALNLFNKVKWEPHEELIQQE